MVKSMDIIYNQVFGEWAHKIFVGVYITLLHNIVENMLPKKMVA